MKNLRHFEVAGLQVVRILLDVTEGPPGSGIEKFSFIADPWENIYELLQVADE
jgi:hypothetical protein